MVDLSIVHVNVYQAGYRDFFKMSSHREKKTEEYGAIFAACFFWHFEQSDTHHIHYATSCPGNIGARLACCYILLLKSDASHFEKAPTLSELLSDLRNFMESQ